MKKSEIYKLAALSVIHDNSYDPEDKLVVLEQLMNDWRVADWFEKNEEEKKNENTY